MALAQLFNRSAGSEASQEALKASAEEIKELRSAAAEDDLVKFGSIYRSLTGKEFDQNKQQRTLFRSNTMWMRIMLRRKMVLSSSLTWELWQHHWGPYDWVRALNLPNRSIPDWVQDL